MISTVGRTADVKLVEPWKKARVTYALWLRLLERLTEHYIDSAARLTDAYRNEGPMTLERAERLRTVAEQARASYWRVLDGDPLTVARLLAEVEV